MPKVTEVRSIKAPGIKIQVYVRKKVQVLTIYLQKYHREMAKNVNRSDNQGLGLGHSFTDETKTTRYGRNVSVKAMMSMCCVCVSSDISYASHAAWPLDFPPSRQYSISTQREEQYLTQHSHLQDASRRNTKPPFAALLPPGVRNAWWRLFTGVIKRRLTPSLTCLII